MPTDDRSETYRRGQAEGAGIESEAQFVEFTEQAPFSVQVLATDGRTVRVNRAWEELWGITLEQISDYNILEDLQLEAKGIAPYIRRAFGGEAVEIPAISYDPNETLPNRTRHQDPSRWVSAVAYPLRDPEGRVRGVVLIHRDITDSKRAEEALRESEARFRVTSKVTGMTLFQQDADLRYVWMHNPIAGHSIESVVGRTDEEIEHTIEDLPALVRAKRDVLATGRGRRVEVVNRMPGGGGQYYDVSLEARRDADGRIVGLVGAGIDITARKAQEEALRASEAHFRGLADALPQLVWTARADGTVEYYNSRSREYSGITPNLDSTWDWQPVVHDDDLEMTVEAWRAAVSAGSVYECEHRIRMADGSFRWHLSRAIPLKDEAGQIIKWFGTATDIHDLRESQQVLRETNRRKDEFLAMLAHELRNPLAPIRNAAQVLKLIGPADANQQWAREIIERQTQHLTRLVDDLLDVSRITQGKITLAREPLDLATVVQRAVEISRPLIEARHHQLTVALAPEPLRVEGDSTRLVQVVGNLLNNAAKYTDEGGHIRVEAAREGQEAVIRVRDNGMGLPADLLPHVFDLFTQADRSLDRSQGGLGIGLTLVRQLAELHGGRVEARSDGPAKGSEFILRLPAVATTDAARVAASPAERVRPDGRALKILVVEDNPDSAEMLAFMLTLGGHQVHVAHNGAEALEAAHTFAPQIVLCDIGLPGMNGYELAARLRQQAEFKRTALIALTGYGQDEERRRAREAGFDYHLTKPVGPESLASLLDSLGADGHTS
ncbi:MAG TPA: PAS domain-containing protein [Blastocatellia bacterium]|nr:PAS domain-containing protein [Blastocatellia bacterium]